MDGADLITRTASGDTDLDVFYHHFFDVLDTIAPITTARVNSPKQAPWLTVELREAQSTHRTIYRRYRRNKRPKYLSAYRTAWDAFVANSVLLAQLTTDLV